MNNDNYKNVEEKANLVKAISGAIGTVLTVAVAILQLVSISNSGND